VHRYDPIINVEEGDTEVVKAHSTSLFPLRVKELIGRFVVACGLENYLEFRCLVDHVLMQMHSNASTFCLLRKSVPSGTPIDNRFGLVLDQICKISRSSTSTTTRKYRLPHAEAKGMNITG